MSARLCVKAAISPLPGQVLGSPPPDRATFRFCFDELLQIVLKVSWYSIPISGQRLNQLMRYLHFGVLSSISERQILDLATSSASTWCGMSPPHAGRRKPCTSIVHGQFHDGNIFAFLQRGGEQRMPPASFGEHVIRDSKNTGSTSLDFTNSRIPQFAVLFQSLIPFWLHDYSFVLAILGLYNLAAFHHAIVGRTISCCLMRANRRDAACERDA